LSSLLAALRSSIGKKYVMGITGLFLCGFLLIHLAGNVLLYAGPEAYNGYSDRLHAQPGFVLFAEILLLLGFVVHIYLAFHTSRENWAARGDVNYSQKQTKIYYRSLAVQAESFMFFTGAVIMVFLLFHLTDFRFPEYVWGDQFENGTAYDKALVILSYTSRKVIYALGSLFVGLHVVHGFRSAFQSLGVNHPKYNKVLQVTSIAFAIVVAIGFASFPLLVSKGSTSMMQPPPAAQAPQ
jgi:succinate dehydrogenase / fumarate reductase cytochrome b subunit